ncbi:membrane protein insertase YidC [Desemzia sp. RIT804]|nr:membrane protein insertase YidC [Desemzia sp. RIT 804]
MKNKKIQLTATLTGLMFFLSGCMSYDTNGNPTGIIYEYLVTPLQQLIIRLADLFGGNYGLAIIAITVIVRIIILPMNLSQSKKALVQQEKMALVKPEMDEIQAALKNAQSSEEKAEIQQEMMEFYKANDINMLGGIGCLPLLIQMPVFTAMYQAINLSNEIASSTFLGVNLGEPYILFAIVAGAIYLGQAYVSMLGMTPEQKKQSRTMMFMSPIMITMISFSSPAGLALYWIAGGIFAMGQSLITNMIFKPKLKARLAEEFKNKPKVEVKKRRPTIIEENETVPQSSYRNHNSNQGRNAGKQRNK